MKRLIPLLLIVTISCASGSSSGPMTSKTARSATPAPAAADVGRNGLVYLPHERVDHWIREFSRGAKRAEFGGYLERKAQHEEMIRAKLRRKGMPEDLLYLAMIESGFNTAATSRDAAVGIWQLVPDTARRWGLRVDDAVDERRDPEKSTDAALSYLSYLYNRFGSWYLAAAAYNTGENRVARAMVEVTGSERGTDPDYYRIIDRLTGETRDFVPAMIAAARIGNDPGRYGF